MPMLPVTRHSWSLIVIGACKLRKTPLGRFGCGLDVLNLVQQYDELVAAEPADDVGIADTPPQSGRDLL